MCATQMADRQPRGRARRSATAAMTSNDGEVVRKTARWPARSHAALAVGRRAFVKRGALRRTGGVGF